MKQRLTRTERLLVATFLVAAAFFGLAAWRLFKNDMDNVLAIIYCGMAVLWTFSAYTYRRDRQAVHQMVEQMSTWRNIIRDLPPE